MHLGISSVNRGTYHLAIYTGGEIFLILSFDWLVLSFFYVTFFYGFYGDLVFFPLRPVTDSFNLYSDKDPNEYDSSHVF